MSGLEGGDGFCSAGLTDKLLSMSDLAEIILADTLNHHPFGFSRSRKSCCLGASSKTNSRTLEPFGGESDLLQAG
jgi:hypothetical protein